MAVAGVEAELVAVAMVEVETVEAIDTMGLVMYLVVAHLIVHGRRGAASKFGYSHYNLVFVIVSYFLVYATL